MSPGSAEAVLLVGMAVREVDRRDELVDLAARAGASVAFLQQGDPSLSRELTRLADSRVERIVVAGVSLGPMGPATSWLRRVAGYWWRERAGHRPVVDVADRLLTVLEPAALADGLRSVRPLHGGEAGLISEAWEHVSGHRRQVMLCRGPRCTALGAEDSVRALIIAMMEHGMGDDDALLVHTGCQFPCNQAPVVSVQPDDVWYGHVDEAAAAQIVEQHLLAGTPLESHRLPRRAAGAGVRVTPESTIGS